MTGRARPACVLATAWRVAKAASKMAFRREAPGDGELLDPDEARELRRLGRALAGRAELRRGAEAEDAHRAYLREAEDAG